VSTGVFELQRPQLPPTAGELRREVREFLAAEAAAGTFTPACDSQVGGFDAEFSRTRGAGGCMGCTWPPRSGGHDRSYLERYVVIEELLVAGAPVGAHWTADRQLGPGLLRYGNEQQRAEFLPRMARGELFFALGISEYEAGSDLSGARTSAVPHDGGGWRLNGRKTWSSHAHKADYIMVFCRTSPAGDDRHAGFSQLIVDLRQPGVTARPIPTMTGEAIFAEVTFTDVVVPAERVLGPVGHAWGQLGSELAHERSGPERFLSTYPLLVELVRLLSADPDRFARYEVGRLVAHLATLRQLSLGVAATLGAGADPDLEAALVKDLGTRLEVEIVRVAQLLAPTDAGPRFRELLWQAELASPSFSIRGGTNEILRGVVARKLGLR
jgi:alkylation response protein AidB-like acyl-CoA dehydrogenase